MQQPSKDDQRNLILAAVLSFAVIALWLVAVRYAGRRFAELTRDGA